VTCRWDQPEPDPGSSPELELQLESVLCDQVSLEPPV
jgi:hypothetical protein